MSDDERGEDRDVDANDDDGIAVSFDEGHDSAVPDRSHDLDDPTRSEMEGEGGPPLADGPLGDLVTDLHDRPDDGAEFDELFEREDVGTIDGDTLWEQLEDDEFDAASVTDRQLHTIEKRSYCQQCEHFSAPPDVGCSHEGTDILEMPSLDTFRVADCPVVLAEERLERGELARKR